MGVDAWVTLGVPWGAEEQMLGVGPLGSFPLGSELNAKG